MSEKLLPCPHCGEAEKLKIQEWQGWLMIVCLKCHPHGALGRGMKVDAIEDWNRRPTPNPDAGLVEALEKSLHQVHELSTYFNMGEGSHDVLLEVEANIIKVGNYPLTSSRLSIIKKWKQKACCLLFWKFL